MARASTRLAQQVATRAGYRCEYCRTPRSITAQTFHTDHIIPTARGGETALNNLCYACPNCNLHKQDRVEAIDPRTKRSTRLFNPRTDLWEEHFRWGVHCERLIGRTAIGRATIAALELNDKDLMHARVMWVQLELLPG
jgi:hypothetical protein